MVSFAQGWQRAVSKARWYCGCSCLQLEVLFVGSGRHNRQAAELWRPPASVALLVLLTTCIVITRRAIASAEGRAVLNSDSYVINRNWKSLIMFGCSESNKTVYKRARANETGQGRPPSRLLGTLRWDHLALWALNWFRWYLDWVIKSSLGVWILTNERSRC